MISYEFLTELNLNPRKRLAFMSQARAPRDAAQLEALLVSGDFEGLAKIAKCGHWERAECVTDPSYDPPPPPPPGMHHDAPPS